ncbi:MAG: glycosyltransferase [Oscillospiraceae bacterium]|nr:glycosyltransferase [Oscillospiraceae bacterium]
MVITVVSDVLGEENNGTTVAAMNLIRALKAAGHTVRVLCADQYRSGQDGWYVVPNLNLGPLNGYVASVGVTLARPQRDVIASALSGADIVHIMIPFALGVAVLHEAKRRGIPVTAGFHAQAENITSYVGMADSRAVGHVCYKVMYQSFYRHVDCIHYPTQFIRDLFEREIGRETVGRVISNGVRGDVQRRETPRPAAWGDKIVILSIGRYAREKSQDTLLRAAAMSRYRDEIQLILAGQGTWEARLRRLGEKLPNPPIMRLFDRKELVDVLNACDLYVHPAEMELEGIACLEALVCGKVTIVSDSPLAATSHFAADESCIFRHRDAADLARVLDRWIDTLKNDPAKLRAYEDKCAASAAVYRLDACMAAMEKMLRETAHGA